MPTNRIPNTKLIGAEWVNNYSYPFSPKRINLTRCGQDAHGFCNTLLGTRRFIYGDGMAWDQDFEQLGASTNHPYGDDATYAETVDILFFAGHGTQDGLLFGMPNHDNGEVKYDEVQLGQGGVIKWFIADTCKVLEDTVPPGAAAFRWGRAFKGLRYLLGFHGDCRDRADRGWRFANHLNGVSTSELQPDGSIITVRVGERIRYAWELACIETEDLASLSCAFLRAGNATSVIHNDRWTDDAVEPDEVSLPTDFTYWRNIPLTPIPF
ncbi:MAG: DUF6345 domain-containing protein [Saprospiraceae bacterium]